MKLRKRNDGDELRADDTPPDAVSQKRFLSQALVSGRCNRGNLVSRRDDISSGVAMALKENLIHCRVDHRDGVRKTFVMPEDEARAREIVREIVEGLPD